jgi:Ribbon-helix-helix protein, copG family
MYNLYIMRRTQIYLSDDQGRLLKRRTRATGRSMSQLIRAAIDVVYSGGREISRNERVRVARRTAGAWSEFPETGTEYVERIRGGVRLARVRAAR